VAPLARPTPEMEQALKRNLLLSSTGAADEAKGFSSGMNDSISGLLSILATALPPASGNVIGSLLAESMRTPRWLIGAALHAAAGIAIAVVSIDFMPRTWEVVDCARRSEAGFSSDAHSGMQGQPGIAPLS
jgi:hypothetical protein